VYLLVKKLESMLFCVRVKNVGKYWEKDALAPVVSTLRGRASPSPAPFRRLWPTDAVTDDADDCEWTGTVS